MVRFFLYRFFYADQRRFFKPRQLHRQITFRQACRGFEESEVGALATREYGEDREPGGFVDHAIQSRKGCNQ